MMDVDSFSLTFSDDVVLSTKAPAPDVIAVDTLSTTTIAIIVILSIVIVTLLFGIAIFIDCRIQKMSKTYSATLFKCKLPGFGRNLDEDEDCFVDKIQSDEVYSSLSSVV